MTLIFWDFFKVNFPVSFTANEAENQQKTRRKKNVLSCVCIVYVLYIPRTEALRQINPEGQINAPRDLSGVTPTFEVFNRLET